MWSHFLRLHNLLALTDNMYVGAEDENTETGTRDAQNVNDLLDVYCYEELEDIIRWLVENGVWIDPNGCCSITKDDAEYANASMVINEYKVAIDPFGDIDRKHFEEEGYTVISSDDLETLKTIIK